MTTTKAGAPSRSAGDQMAGTATRTPASPPRPRRAPAIALTRYEQNAMLAPTVVAKGADYVAEKIKEIAKANGVPTIENKPLAQVLYKTVKVDGAIPDSLYKAVAEILAYVYSLKH